MSRAFMLSVLHTTVLVLVFPPVAATSQTTMTARASAVQFALFLGAGSPQADDNATGPHGTNARCHYSDLGFLRYPADVVDAVVKFAAIGARDVVYDVGWGDSAFVIEAAQAGARGVDFPSCAKGFSEAAYNAARAGLASRVRLLNCDFLSPSVRFSEATVVVMHLDDPLTRELLDKLRTELRAGAHIVSISHEAQSCYRPNKTFPLNSSVTFVKGAAPAVTRLLGWTTPLACAGGRTAAGVPSSSRTSTSPPLDRTAGSPPVQEGRFVSFLENTASGQGGTGTVRPSQDRQETVGTTVAAFRKMSTTQQRSALDRWVGEVSAMLSSTVDPLSGKAKSEPDRRRDTAMLALVRSLFTSGGRGLDALGYVELGRRLATVDESSDDRVDALCSAYLRERFTQLVTTQILAMNSADQEAALRVAVAKATVGLYEADYQAAKLREVEAKLREADARAREKSAATRLEGIRLNDLGVDYSRNRDYTNALASYRSAVEHGNAEAMCNIGRMYLNGQGVAQNSQQAFEWCLRGAQGGSANAMAMVSLAYDTDLDIRRNFFPDLPKNAAESFAWALKAANLGQVQAMRNLARMYATGQGTKPDSAEANRWMERSREVIKKDPR